MSVSLSPNANFLSNESLSSDFEVLVDKLSERLSFEAMGVHLYELLIQKEEGCPQLRADFLKISDEKREHVRLITQLIRLLGAEPVVQNSWAYCNAVASAGFSQIISSPKVPLKKALQTILVTELADHAGWGFLIDLAQESGQSDLLRTFQHIRNRESEHLTWVKDHLKNLTSGDLEGRVQ